MQIGYGVLLSWQLPLKANLQLMVRFMQQGKDICDWISPLNKRSGLPFILPEESMERN